MQKAINSYVRHDTLFSPEHLLFGMRGTNLVSAFVPQWQQESLLSKKLQLQAKMQEIDAELEGRARRVVILDGEEIRPGAGANRLPVKTLVGVRFRSTPKGTIAKWRVQTKGPYEIVEYLNDATVKLRHVRTGDVIERATEDIRMWVDADEPEASFEVQAVKDEQLKPKHRFLIQFRGFLQPEWVEAENINCWDRVDAFRQANPSLFSSKVIVQKIVKRKKVGKTEQFKIIEVGEDLDVKDARWIRKDDFRNPEIISLRAQKKKN